MNESESVQDYSSTLTFSVLCSTFDVSVAAPNTQIKSRIFDKASAILSQYGCWHCIFTETKRKNKAGIELNLSLTWRSYQDPASSSSFPTSFNLQEMAKGQQGVASNARELISRIQSIKMRSDSTLSELLVDRLDGHRIYEGDTIQGTFGLYFCFFSLPSSSCACLIEMFMVQKFSQAAVGKGDEERTIQVQNRISYTGHLEISVPRIPYPPLLSRHLHRL